MGILGAILIAIASLVARPVWAEGEDINYDSQMNGGSSNNGGNATGSCGGGFLGLKPWYDGLCDASGKIISVCEKNDNTCPPGSKSIQSFVWRIVLNVLFDITLIIGYIGAAMIIYGGYLFMMSQGDPSRAARGKKTITAAIIGMVIGMGASVFVNTAIQILQINQSNGWQQATFTADTLDKIFSWAYAMAGVVAVGFIIKSGVDYMISTGDPGKTRKATHALIYSVVGLVVVILAAVITSFIIKSIGGAM